MAMALLIANVGDDQCMGPGGFAYVQRREKKEGWKGGQSCCLGVFRNWMYVSVVEQSYGSCSA